MDPVAESAGGGGVTNRRDRAIAWAGSRGVLLAGCVLAACTGADGPAAAAKAPIPPPSVGGKAACFHAREVQNFRVLDRSNLIVFAPNESNAYHLRISPPASELRWADTIAFLPANGQICGFAGDRLVVGPPGAAEGFAIIDVGWLSPGSLEALGGAGGGSAQPAAPRPQPGPGAEVEGRAPEAPPAEPDNGGES